MFEYKTGSAPSRAVAPEVELRFDEADASEEEDIDWGDLDLDVVEGTPSLFGPERIRTLDNSHSKDLHI